MVRLVPAIHAFLAERPTKDVDTRDKRGYDDGQEIRSSSERALYLYGFVSGAAHRLDGQRHRFQDPEIEPRSMVDVEADDFSAGIEVDVEALRHLAHFDARCRLQFDLETVHLGVVVQHHGLSL